MCPCRETVEKRFSAGTPGFHVEKRKDLDEYTLLAHTLVALFEWTGKPRFL
jgi:hypothetical protein